MSSIVDALGVLVSKVGQLGGRLGKTAVFLSSDTGKPYDVVYVEVVSPDLVRLNALLRSRIQHVEIHPDYVPHICIAYCKPGAGQQYAGMADVEGEHFTANTVAFSGKDRQKVDVPVFESGATPDPLLRVLESAGTVQEARRMLESGLCPAPIAAESFEESQHPRDHGKFSTKQGNGAENHEMDSKKSNPPANTKVKEPEKPAMKTKLNGTIREIQDAAEHIGGSAVDGICGNGGLSGATAEQLNRILERARKQGWKP